MESLTGWLRDKSFNTTWFVSLDDARGTIEALLQYYVAPTAR
ncbi:transposase [Hydrogenophaga sp. 2FB]|nr:transposase [Hydrogenophaga sp. 2FB]